MTASILGLFGSEGLIAGTLYSLLTNHFPGLSDKTRLVILHRAVIESPISEPAVFFEPAKSGGVEFSLETMAWRVTDAGGEVVAEGVLRCCYDSEHDTFYAHRPEIKQGTVISPEEKHT